MRNVVKLFLENQKILGENSVAKNALQVVIQRSTVDQECKGCNKSFSRKPEDTWRKFCSKECSSKVIVAKPVIINSHCEICNTSFLRKPEETWKKFCSKECSFKKSKCKRCGKPFIKNEKWQVCCDQQCLDLLLIAKKCDKCNKDFQVINSERWKKFCGRSSCVTSNEVATTNSDESKSYSTKAIIWLEGIIQKKELIYNML